MLSSTSRMRGSSPRNSSNLVNPIEVFLCPTKSTSRQSPAWKISRPWSSRKETAFGNNRTWLSSPTTGKWALDALYRCGFLQSELSPSDGDDDEADVVYVFPSILHKRWVISGVDWGMMRWQVLDTMSIACLRNHLCFHGREYLICTSSYWTVCHGSQQLW